MTLGAELRPATTPVDCLLLASSLDLSAEEVAGVVLVGAGFVVASDLSDFFSSFYLGAVLLAAVSFLAAAAAAAFLSTGTTSVRPPAFILYLRLSSMGSASSGLVFFFSPKVMFTVPDGFDTTGFLVLSAPADDFFSSASLAAGVFLS